MPLPVSTLGRYGSLDALIARRVGFVGSVLVVGLLVLAGTLLISVTQRALPEKTSMAGNATSITDQIAAPSTIRVSPSMSDPGNGRNSQSTQGGHSTSSLPVPGQSAPSPRELAASTWDAADGYALLFGGYGEGGESSIVGALNDTWSFVGGNWTQLHPNYSPAPLWGASMAYDPTDSATILFGGWTCGNPPAGSTCVATLSNDTWSFRSGSWTPLNLSVAPSPRASASLSYDPLLGGLILFGGLSHGTDNDTWLFLNGAWKNLTLSIAGAPPARTEAALSYDPGAQGLYLFGGATGASVSSNLFNDTWILRNSSWINITNPVEPAPSAYSEFTYDPSDSGSILFGGLNSTLSSPSRETWELKNGTWQQLQPQIEPPGIWGAIFVYDPSDGYALLFSGNTLSPESGSSTGIEANAWIFDGATWDPLGSNLSLPAAGNSAMAYDPTEGGEILYSGGFQGFTSTSTGTTWLFKNGNWSPLLTAIAPPSRFDPAVAYDYTDGYLILFGGYSPDSSTASGFLNDTWIFYNSTWHAILTTVAPAPREGAVMTYDAADGDVVLFGGRGVADYSDTWTWAGGRWSEIPTAPPAQLGSWGDVRGVYDPLTRSVVLSEGFNTTCSGVSGACMKTWTLSKGNWSAVTTSNLRAWVTEGFSMAWDGALGAVVIFGGFGVQSEYGYNVSNQTWAYVNQTWARIATQLNPSARLDAAFAWDNSTGSDLLFGGETFATLGGTIPGPADTWSLNSTVWTQVDPIIAASFAELDVGVNLTLTSVTGLTSSSTVYQYYGLPTGCETSNRSVLTCTPSTAGVYFPTVALSLGFDLNSSATTRVSVQPTLSIKAFFADDSRVSVGGRVTFFAMVSGGTGPFEYAYSGLPSGCRATDSAEFTCEPTASGDYSVKINVTDFFGERATAQVGLSVGITPSVSTFLSSGYGLLVVGILLAGVVIGTRGLQIRIRREGDELVSEMRRLDADEPAAPPGESRRADVSRPVLDERTPPNG